MSKSRASRSADRTPKKSDDAILEERIQANTLEFPKQVLFVVGLAVSFLPAYLSHAVNNLSWFNLLNLPLYAIVIAGTTYMMGNAYAVMVESEFWRRQRHYQEVKPEDEDALRKLRLQAAMAYSLFFLNLLFVVVCTLFHLYIFRHTDSRASLILSPMLTAAGVWFVAQKNEESRKRRLTKHK